MSKIIKSFRVVNNESFPKEDEEDKDSMDNNYKDKVQKAEIQASIDSKKIIHDAERTADIIKLKAEAEAKEIIEKAKLEAKQMEESTIKLSEEKGYNIGYKKGYESGEINSKDLIDEAMKLKDKYIKQRDTILVDTEKDIIDLVKVLTGKIIYTKMEKDDSLIIDLVTKNIKSLESIEKAIIICSEEDFNIISNKKNEILLEASLIKDIDIKCDTDLNKGDLIIETPNGDIDISISLQLNELNTYLDKILNNE